MSKSTTTCLYIFDGGSFKRVPHLLYTESEASDVYMDLDYMSAYDIKERVVNLGYSKERIKEMYFSRPDVPFEYSLVPIQSNKEVRELIKLYSESDIVSIYVEHNVDEIDKGKGVLVNEDMDENIGVDSNEEACFLDMYEFNDKYDTND